MIVERHNWAAATGERTASPFGPHQARWETDRGGPRLPRTRRATIPCRSNPTGNTQLHGLAFWYTLRDYRTAEPGGGVPHGRPATIKER
jgi:hypothetical protein